MELKSIILNSTYKPIGFEVKDKESLKIISFEDFIKEKPKCYNLAIINDEFIEINNFKLNSLPMKIKINNELNLLNNELKIIKKIIANNKLIGFEVFFDNKFLSFLLPEFYNLARFTSNQNFILKKNKNNYFVSGKNLKINNLPETILDDSIKINSKATVSRTKIKKFEKNFDIIDILNFVKSLNGLILKFPEDIYKKTKINKKDVSDEFISLGIGEISSPDIKFNETNLNLNLTFKNYGNVATVFKDKFINVSAYTLSTKHIFFNGDNHLNNFGIIITPDKEDLLKDYFKETLIINEIKDKKILNNLKSILAKKDLKLYKVDTTKLEFIKNDKIINLKLSTKEIKKLTEDLIYKKAIKKYLTYEKKLIEEELNKLKESKPKEKIGIYNFADDDINFHLENIGIDIYTGMFKKTKESKVSKTKELKNIEINYELKGFKTIPTGKELKSNSLKVSKFISKQFEDIKNDIDKQTDIKNKYSIIENSLKELNSEIFSILETLWKYKLICFKNGNSLYYRDFNEFNLLKETDNFTEYQSKEYPELLLKLKEIKKKE